MPSTGVCHGAFSVSPAVAALTDFRDSSSPGKVRRNSAACWAQIGTHRRRSIECTLATGFFPHRRSREPAFPIAFPHLPTDLSADLLRGMEVPPTLNLEDHSFFIYVCGLSAAPVLAQ